MVEDPPQWYGPGKGDRRHAGVVTPSCLLSVSGRMSDTNGTGADMGLVTYSCYTFEGGQGLLRKTELRADGILEYHNTSPNAIALADWMASIR